MATDDNYTVFRECLSSAIVARSEGKTKTSKRRQKPKRSERKEVTSTGTALPERANPEELAEFIDVHAHSMDQDLYTQHDQQKTSQATN